MEFHNVLKQLRQEQKLSQLTVAKHLGIAPSTYSLYEGGKREPNIQFLKKLAQFFGCSLDTLLGVPQKILASLSDHEQNLLTSYRSLNWEGRQKLLEYLDDLNKLYAQTAKPAQAIEPSAVDRGAISVFPIPYYDVPVSAGTGQFLDSTSAEMLELSSPPPQGASFVVRVSGDSMLPTYSDGDKVFIHAQSTLEVGEVGIFSVDGDVYIKELGRGKLLSHNKKYPSISLEEYSSVYCYGKVMGICAL